MLFSNFFSSIVYCNNLTDGSCSHLVSEMRNNWTKRSAFRLNINSFFSVILHFCSLNYNHLTDSSCPKLATGIRKNQRLRRLDLSGNNLEGPHFSDLMTALRTSQIEELLWVELVHDMAIYIMDLHFATMGLIYIGECILLTTLFTPIYYIYCGLHFTAHS